MEFWSYTRLVDGKSGNSFREIFLIPGNYERSFILAGFEKT